ncbi:MAG: hypothetical protein ACK4ME_07090 [Fimbriimonadales bacterium]
MSILHECLNYWLQRYGEPFQVGAQLYRGVFFQPPAGLLRWHFSPTTLDALPRPLWAIALTANLPVNTTLTWRGDAYRVLKLIEFRIDTQAVYRIALIQPLP